MPWQLVSVYRNVCSGPPYGPLSTGDPNGSTAMVGLLLQVPWPFEDDADALVVAATPAPPTAIATMTASPMRAGQRRRRSLPISRMMRSLRETVSLCIVSVNNDDVTPHRTKSHTDFVGASDLPQRAGGRGTAAGRWARSHGNLCSSARRPGKAMMQCSGVQLAPG